MSLSRTMGALVPLALLACGQTPQGAASGLDGALTCIGPRPPAAAFGAAPGPLRTGDGGGPHFADGGCSGAGCLATPAPLWALNDFQPSSCGFRATYGLDLFRGEVVVVGLWAGW